MCGSCLAVFERLSAAEARTAGWIRGVVRSSLVTFSAASHLFFDEMCQMVVWGGKKVCIFCNNEATVSQIMSVKTLI